MKYYKEDNLHIIECEIEEFSIILENKKKKDIEHETFVNGNFFGSYDEGSENFTLPAGHLIADDNLSGYWSRFYCKERGEFKNNKFYFDSGKWKYMNPLFNKSISTFIIENNNCFIKEIQFIEDSYKYAVSGIPVIRDGKDVSFSRDVLIQGWNGSELYNTKHIFIGLKENSKTIYILGYKSNSSNLILSSEVYNILKKKNFYDVIKLDGGGSYYFKYNGNVIDSTLENRRINAVICIKNAEKNSFNDVPSDWAEISWNKAINKGCIDGTNPKEPVTREMLSVILDKLGLLQ